MPKNLPTDLLRSFLAIVDTGSMMRATDQVFLSPSALSLQMKRLEELVEHPLFQRSGRGLVLTPPGREMVETARRMLELNDRLVASLNGDTFSGPVNLGMVQDFAESLLPDILSRFAVLHPRTHLHLRVAGSPDLTDAVSRGELDLALCMGRPGEREGLATSPMIWIGNPALLDAPEIPLVLLDKPCLFRSTALRALGEAGLRFRIALETPSLSGLRAAVQADFGITCRTHLLADLAGLPVLTNQALPALPPVATLMLRGPAPSAACRQLASLLETAYHRSLPPRGERHSKAS
jgi:DNA-binding transcriptional LysR family regulator